MKKQTPIQVLYLDRNSILFGTIMKVFKPQNLVAHYESFDRKTYIPKSKCLIVKDFNPAIIQLIQDLCQLIKFYEERYSNIVRTVSQGTTEIDKSQEIINRLFNFKL